MISLLHDIERNVSDRDTTLYRFNTNVVAVAGAGTGKTYRLSSVYLHLVLGLTNVRTTRNDYEARRVPAQRILATTFTRDAAAEMRDRIEARLRFLATLAHRSLDELADHPSNGPWVRELIHSATRLNQGVFDKQTLATVLRDNANKALGELAHAQITTLHGFASQMLRTHPLEAKVPPGFQILEPRDSKMMMARQVVGTIDGIAGNPACHHRLIALYRAIGGREGLIRSVEDVLSTLTEEGLDSSLLHVDPDEAHPADTLREVVACLGRFFSENPGAFWAKPSAKNLESIFHARPDHQRLREIAGELVPILEKLHARTDSDITEDVVEDAIRQVHEHRRDFVELGETMKRVYDVFCRCRSDTFRCIRDDLAMALGLPSPEDLGKQMIALACHAPLRASAEPLAQLFKTIVARVANDLRQARLAVGVLDFSDLMLAARDLLRDHPDVQLRVGAEYDAILVDEFQDTNCVQRDLVFLMHQRPDRIETRQGGAQVDASELRPCGLLLVGDRKQSIYGFRGADIAVFQNACVELCGDLAKDKLAIQGTSSTRTGSSKPCAQLVTLDVNRRSHPKLLSFFNAVSEADIRFEEAEPALQPLPAFERLTFSAAERLHPPPDFAGGDTKPHAHLIRPVVSGTTRSAEQASGTSQLSYAVCTATLVHGLIRGALDVLTYSGSAPDAAPTTTRITPVQRGPSDIAVLVRSYTAARPLCSLLDELAIPYAFGGRGGLFTSVEARDLLALAQSLSDPSDRIALVNVLRGPLVGATDVCLLAIAIAASAHTPRLPHAESLVSLLVDPTHEATLCAVPQQELARVLLFSQAYSLVRRHIHRLGASPALRMVIDMLRFEETLAVLPRGAQRIANVRATLHEAERVAPTLRDFVRFFDHVDRYGGDLDAPIALDPDDPAVLLMTIHGSKGLEYPVVILMQAGSPLVNDNGPVFFGRNNGHLGIAIGSHPGSGGAKLRALGYARDWAERQRLSYVALTRAKDELFIVGCASDRKAAKGSLLASIEGRLPDLVDASIVDVLHVSADLPPTRPISLEYPHKISDAQQADLRALANELRPPVPDAESLDLSQTTLVVTPLSDFATCPRRFELAHVMSIDEHASLAIDDEEPPQEADDDEALETREAVAFPIKPDARARGSLLHAALERLSESHFRAPDQASEWLGKAPDFSAVIEAFLEQTDAYDEPSRVYIRDRVLRWVQSDLAMDIVRGVADGSVEVLTEFAFHVPVSANGPFLKGTMDLIALHKSADGSVRKVTIIDYKSGRHSPHGSDGDDEAPDGPYAYQMAAYCFAASRLWPSAAAHEAGLAFLGGERLRLVMSGPRNLDLVDTARRMITSRITGNYPGFEDDQTCHALRCGYLTLCHPRGPDDARSSTAPGRGKLPVL